MVLSNYFAGLLTYFCELLICAKYKLLGAISIHFVLKLKFNSISSITMDFRIA